MMNAVDKYSTDNIADNEMMIAVDDVVKKFSAVGNPICKLIASR